MSAPVTVTWAAPRLHLITATGRSRGGGQQGAKENGHVVWSHITYNNMGYNCSQCIVGVGNIANS